MELVPGLAERLCRFCNNLIFRNEEGDWIRNDSDLYCGDLPHQPYPEGVYHSYKFSSELAEILHLFSMDSSQDEELGEADTFGWYALFRDCSAILACDSQGFVTASVYTDDQPESVETVWEELESQWEAHNTFECEVCGEVTPDEEGQNVRSDDGFMTVCDHCYDPTRMQTIFS